MPSKVNRLWTLLTSAHRKVSLGDDASVETRRISILVFHLARALRNEGARRVSKNEGAIEFEGAEPLQLGRHRLLSGIGSGQLALKRVGNALECLVSVSTKGVTIAYFGVSLASVAVLWIAEAPWWANFFGPLVLFLLGSIATAEHAASAIADFVRRTWKEVVGKSAGLNPGDGEALGGDVSDGSGTPR